MNRFTILILLLSPVTFGQETTARLRPGIQIATVFSDNDDHGLSPALSLSYGRCMLTLGPRFTYERISEKKSSFYKQDDQLILDAAFRYYLLPESRRVRPFAQLGATYKYTYVAYQQEYRDGMMLTYGPTYHYDFLGEWNRIRHNVNICAGFGMDIKIWKQLSVFVSAAAGTSVTWGKARLTNLETGTQEDFYRLRNAGKFSWIASAGFAYRFFYQ